MKTSNTKSMFSSITAGLLVGLGATPGHSYGEEVLYRFTGTVEASDPRFGFSSPVPISDEIQAQVGDQIAGTFGFTNPYPHLGNTLLQSPWEAKGYYNSLSRQELSMSVVINGYELTSTWNLGVYIANDFSSSKFFDLIGRTPTEGSPEIGWSWDLPLADSGDAFSMVMGRRESSSRNDGILIDDALLPQPLRNQPLEVTLNFTDSTGRVFDEDASFPPAIDFHAFDIVKGLISIGRPGDGILFNIDSIELFDPNAPVLTTGYHVAWPIDAEGYTLEESVSPEGPWMPSSVTPTVVENQNIVIMDVQSRLKFYRLTKAE
jgi:hypothetical protein